MRSPKPLRSIGRCVAPRTSWFSLALRCCAGCGSSDGGDTPTACLAPAATYLKALEAAPEPGATGRRDADLRLPGGRPVGGRPGRRRRLAGAAATVLSAGAHGTPAAPQTLRLGYLVGAVQEGASETSGIHADLVRRIEAASRYLKPGGTSSFDLAYARGYAAGRSGG